MLLTSCLTGLDKFVLQIKTKIVSCHIADSKPVKQEVNGTVILPPLVFPVESDERSSLFCCVIGVAKRKFYNNLRQEKLLEAEEELRIGEKVFDSDQLFSIQENAELVSHLIKPFSLSLIAK